ncbi:MAG TPA: DUF4142 domain-containing protein, partial [Polyangia bacterium]|nr:DUF4142 domain-containing protein [Polyangia bacterium]
MGKAKLGSWWAAGAAVCLLVSAGVAAQTAAPDTPAPAAATVNSRHDERGGADQRILTELHRRNQEVMADARIAERRATRASVRDYAAKLLDARAADDAKIVGYARRLGMSVSSIELGAGATADGSLTRVDLIASPPARFDYDFATKMVSSTQATLDQTEKGEAMARAPGMAALL